MMKYLSIVAAVLMAPAEMARGGDAAPAPEPALEIVTFRLVEGTDTAAFLDAARGTEAWLRGTGAVITRSLSVDDTGLWTDTITWTSKSAALAAAAEAMTRPEFAPFMGAIDADTTQMRHADILWQMD